MKYSTTAFVVLGIIIGQQTFSQTCCSGGVPLSNNLGLPNEGKGSFLAGLNYDYNNLNTLNAGNDRLDDSSRLRITHSVLLSLGYAFSDRFSVESLLTWVNQNRTINQFGNENVTETFGVGDAVFLTKYTMPNMFGAQSALNVGFGLKAPLGKSDLTTSQGFQLTADLQPGSGAWDLIGLLFFSKSLPSRPSAVASLGLNLRYTGTNKDYLNNTATYEFGDEIQAYLGYKEEFLLFNAVFSAGLVLKYRKAKADEIDNSILPNTGGEWVFVRPEFSTNLTQNISVVSKLELPLYSYVDGTQLTPTLRFTTGINILLKKRQSNIFVN